MTERCCDKVFDCIENNFCKKCDKELCKNHTFWKDGDDGMEYAYCSLCYSWEGLWCDEHEQVMYKDGMKCSGCLDDEEEYEEYLVLWNKNKMYKIPPMMTFNEFTEHRKLFYVNLAEDANMFKTNQ